MQAAGHFYDRIGESTYDSLPATAGPWSADFQHAGPPSALLLKEIEDHRLPPETRVARICLDILGPVPVSPLAIEIRVLKPGRATSLVEASAFPVTSAGGSRQRDAGNIHEGEAVLTLRAWLHRRVDAAFPTSRQDIPKATAVRPRASAPRRGSLPGAYNDGYMAATEWSFTSGGFDSFGPAAAWGRSLLTLVEGEALTSWQRTLVLTDTAGGISLNADPLRFPAINTDLTVAMYRDPIGEWIHIGAATHAEPGHGALAQAVLSDVDGRVGASLQALFARTATV